MESTMQAERGVQERKLSAADAAVAAARRELLRQKNEFKRAAQAHWQAVNYNFYQCYHQAASTAPMDGRGGHGGDGGGGGGYFVPVGYYYVPPPAAVVEVKKRGAADGDAMCTDSLSNSNSSVASDVGAVLLPSAQTWRRGHAHHGRARRARRSSSSSNSSRNTTIPSIQHRDDIATTSGSGSGSGSGSVSPASTSSSPSPTQLQESVPPPTTPHEAHRPSQPQRQQPQPQPQSQSQRQSASSRTRTACVFFGTAAGCRFGSACTFKHVAVADGEVRPTRCKFVGAPGGCRNGDTCQFSHDK